MHQYCSGDESGSAYEDRGSVLSPPVEDGGHKTLGIAHGFIEERDRCWKVEPDLAGHVVGFQPQPRPELASQAPHPIIVAHADHVELADAAVLRSMRSEPTPTASPATCRPRNSAEAYISEPMNAP